MHLAYQDTTPHVVWSELQARKSGGQIFFADWHSRIMHWSSTGGVAVVKQGGPETGSYDNVDNGQLGPVVGLNHISNDWPQVGFSADGSEAYVVWVRCVDAEVDPTANAGIPGSTGLGFGDIEVSVSRHGGPWSATQNLTQTPQTDERFVAIAPKNSGGNVGILFQASATNQAGIAESQDRGTTPTLYVRRIAWLERHVGASLVAVEDGPAGATTRVALAVHPNPARGPCTLWRGRTASRARCWCARWTAVGSRDCRRNRTRTVGRTRCARPPCCRWSLLRTARGRSPGRREVHVVELRSGAAHVTARPETPTRFRHVRTADERTERSAV